MGRHRIFPIIDVYLLAGHLKPLFIIKNRRVTVLLRSHIPYHRVKQVVFTALTDHTHITTNTDPLLATAGGRKISPGFTFLLLSRLNGSLQHIQIHLPV